MRILHLANQRSVLETSRGPFSIQFFFRGGETEHVLCYLFTPFF